MFLLLVLCACQKTSQEPMSRFATFTVDAVKDDATKALSLDGNTLNAYWKSTENVLVYNTAGELIGTLNVAPEAGERPSSATLSGTLDVSGLSVGDNLSLRLPRAAWDYSGQTGVLTGSGSIEELYDYASASVSIASIGENSVQPTSGAHFANEQSIYRFGFYADATPLGVKLFAVDAASGRIVKRIEDGTSEYGTLKIIPDSPTTELIYTSIRNESVAPESSGDTYYFTVVGSDGSTYLATKAIPGSVLDRHGRLISAKTIPATKVTLSQHTTETAEVF
ncbi:MAG: hypothetical protein IJ543_03790 [Bacteroidales bacterium]|nr:hypothetical protein [Bacteroidales bacterium]